MTEATTDPYAAAHTDYWAAGWRSVLPLPYRAKKSPPEGYTGYQAAVPSFADVTAWAMDGPQNLALRLPPGVIGLDVDAYGGKPGARTLADLVAEHGPLPPTWLSSSRGDGISGIRLFRLADPAMRLITALPGIELIQAHHRYVVAAPSVHPDTNAPYVWIDEQTGTVGDGVPVLADLPLLPAAWAQALQATGTPTAKTDVDPAGVLAVLDAMPDGDPCHHILAAAGKAIGDGNRHDTYNAAVMAVVGAGRRGCPGAVAVLRRLQAAFTAEVTTVAQTKRTKAEAAAEWMRSLTGAVAVVADEAQGTTCPDDWMEWVTTAGEAPQEAPAGEEKAEEVDAAEFAYRQAVARKAADLQLMEDARSLLATRRAGDAPALDATPLPTFLAQPDEITPYRIDGLWPINGRVLLAAAAKAGKTTMVMNLLKALADGGQFLGCFDVDPVPEGRTVVYLNLEVSAAQMRRWMRRAGIVNADRIVVANLRGLLGALPLGSEQGRRRISDWLAAHHAEVVILDPLAPLLGALGLEEKENSDIARFFAWWSSCLHDAGVVDDFICHHAGWDGTRSRGASRLVDEPDAVWTISRDKATDEDDDDVYGGLEPRFFKAVGRDVEQPEQPLDFDGATGVLTLGQGSRKALRTRAKEYAAERRVLEALTGANDGLTRREIEECGGNKGENFAAVERLIAAGKVLKKELNARHHRYEIAPWIGVPSVPGDTLGTRGHVVSPTPIGGDTTCLPHDGHIRDCERCGRDTGAAGARYCRDCAAASLRGEGL